MVVTGLSAGGGYVHVTTVEGAMTLTYTQCKILKKHSLTALTFSRPSAKR